MVHLLKANGAGGAVRGALHPLWCDGIVSHGSALCLQLVVFLLKAVLWYFIAAVFENAMARTRFMNAPAVIWLALGMALLSFVFYLANV